MEYEILLTEETEGILTVTINRPKAMNALNTQFFREMDALLSEVEGRDDLKAMIITGAGKAFVAGADIAEMSEMTPEKAAEFSRKGQKTLDRFEALRIPVIAAVNGFALGGGCELSMACDMRIASSKAKFGQPEVNLGLTPGYAGTQRLPRLVGLGDALHMLLTGDMIGAEEALRIGLVQKVVEPEELLPAAQKTAKTIASKGPKAVQHVKLLARQGLMSDFQKGCEMESEKFGSLFKDEGIEGMRAFLEKRKPNW